MSQYSHPNCQHPQPHCPFCDCDDCFRVAQQEVRRNGSGANDARSEAALLPGASLNPAAVPPHPQRSSWLSSPSTRYMLIAGVAALTVGFWVASHHRRSHHFIVHHRMSAPPVSLMSPPVGPPPPPPSSLPAGMGQYEAGFLKGSEVTASMYRAAHASLADAWRTQWSNKGWCRQRSW